MLKGTVVSPINFVISGLVVTFRESPKVVGDAFMVGNTKIERHCLDDVIPRPTGNALKFARGAHVVPQLETFPGERPSLAIWGDADSWMIRLEASAILAISFLPSLCFDWEPIARAFVLDLLVHCGNMKKEAILADVREHMRSRLSRGDYQPSDKDLELMLMALFNEDLVFSYDLSEEASRIEDNSPMAELFHRTLSFAVSRKGADLVPGSQS